jgi:hypothetical protein
MKLSSLHANVSVVTLARIVQSHALELLVSSVPAQTMVRACSMTLDLQLSATAMTASLVTTVFLHAHEIK